MSTSTSKTYDTIVIGAGIAGSSIAYILAKRGQNVLLVDRSSVPASGGSGAAGAFVSPKIGKGGPLQQLTNEAFAYAQEFYVQNFPEHFEQSGVVRIPRDDVDAEKFPLYEPYNYPNYEIWDGAKLATHGIMDKNGGFFFPEAGDCDAPAMCRAMAAEVEFGQFDVGSLERVDGVWKIVSSEQLAVSSVGWGVPTPTMDDKNSTRSKSTLKGVRPTDDKSLRDKSQITRPLLAHNVVLATGYQNDLVDMRYMGIKGLWGSRGDFMTDANLPVSLHKTLSVSSSRDGIVKIGATHNKASNPCMVCDGNPLAPLLEKASELVDTSDFRLKETFCGMRSGSRDYFPVVGQVVDVEYMLEHYPAVTRGAKPPLRHFDNLFVLNGLGGRGFVFAPLMATWLADLIVEDTKIPLSVEPDRLFWKWVRKKDK